MMPPTHMIGAETMSVQVISTSICTCWTSFVVRVMSDGAPKCVTSRAEKLPTRWKTAARRSRPKPIALRAPKYTAAIAQTIWTNVMPSMIDADLQDVRRVALGDAVVDDVGVERRQVERREGAEELEDDDGESAAL